MIMARLFLAGCMLLLIFVTPVYAVSSFSVRAFLDWESMAVSTSPGMTWYWGTTSFSDGGWVNHVYGSDPFSSAAWGDWWSLPIPFGYPGGWTGHDQVCIGKDGSWPVGSGCSVFSIYSGKGMSIETTGIALDGILFSESMAYYYVPLQVEGTGWLNISIDYSVDLTLSSLAQTNVVLSLGTSHVGFQQVTKEGSGMSGLLQGTLSISRYIDRSDRGLEMRTTIQSFAKASPIPEPTTGVLFFVGGIVMCLGSRNTSRSAPFFEAEK